jgi:hypothetical protein
VNGIEERIAEVLGRAQALGGRESLNADNLADLLVAELGLREETQRVWPDEGDAYSERYWRTEGEQFYDDRFWP